MSESGWNARAGGEKGGEKEPKGGVRSENEGGKEALLEESEASSRIPGNPGMFETGSAVPLQAATGTSDQGNAESALDKATHLLAVSISWR